MARSRHNDGVEAFPLLGGIGKLVLPMVFTVWSTAFTRSWAA